MKKFFVYLIIFFCSRAYSYELLWYADATNLSLKNSLLANSVSSCFYNPAKSKIGINFYGGSIYSSSSSLKAFSFAKRFFSGSYQRREIEEMTEEIFSFGLNSSLKTLDFGINYNYFKQKIFSFQNTSSFFNFSTIYSFQKISFSYSAINLIANFGSGKLPYYHLIETEYKLSSKTTLGLSLNKKQDFSENFIFSSKYKVNEKFGINTSYETRIKTLGLGLSYKVKNFISCFSLNYFQENKPTIGLSFAYEI